jgi:transposase-like protein
VCEVGRPDFPKSLKEFQARFREDDACRAYLAACRWPEGFRCARCGQGAAFELPQRRLWQCKACGRQTSLTAGSVLHRTRLPLTVWFWATYLVTTHTPGLSAVQLQRQLGISYETPGPSCTAAAGHGEPRAGTVEGQGEVDETYLGAEAGLEGAANSWTRR